MTETPTETAVRLPDPLWVEDVRPEWIDYNGHLSEAYYVLVFGHATDAFLAWLGMSPDHVAAVGTSMYTLEAHVRYLYQVPPGARLQVRTSVLQVTAKLLWLWHEMWCDGELRATEEVLMVHVDALVGRSSPMPDALRERIEQLQVPVPEQASRRITLG
ncbi:thioesterase family protein [Pseudonocardia sp. CA-107938]|uniref:thioesterase family protein n=1 Tax=Pseudonocardia sp. CA-107938 TaxID=3240021 RepID=UPI003D8BFE86